MSTQPFYNTGTAVLTNGSKNMVGTGTFWSGAIRQFDRVVGADGKENIVDIVVDNTHITLLDNWAGVTQATGLYKIWMSPDEIYLQTLTRAIFAALQSSALTGISGLTPVANTLPYFDASNTAALAAVTAFARSILDDPDASTALSTLGVTTFVKTILDDTSAGAVLTTLGVSAFIQTFIVATTGIAALDLLTGRGADIASAATVVLNASTGDVVDITGTVATSAITLADGEVRWTRAVAAWPLTVGASLILNNGGANYTCTAGDLIVWRGYAAGVVRGTIFPIDGFGAATSPLGQSLIAATTAALMQSVMGVREVLTADRTYFVRTDGNDANTGLANTSGAAFLTIQRAVNAFAALDMNIFNGTISIADGTYTAGATVNGAWLGSKNVSIVGNTGTPANVFINATGNGIVVQNGGRISVSGVKVSSTGVSLWAQTNSTITIGGAIELGSASSYQMYATDGGTIQANANWTISGGTTYSIGAQNYGVINAAGRAVTLTGTPAWSGAFANASLGGMVLINSFTFTGTATGQRYSVASAGICATFSGNAATYLPGNSAGSVSGVGSQYF